MIDSIKQNTTALYNWTKENSPQIAKVTCMALAMLGVAFAAWGAKNIAFSSEEYGVDKIFNGLLLVVVAKTALDCLKTPVPGASS